MSHALVALPWRSWLGLRPPLVDAFAEVLGGEPLPRRCLYRRLCARVPEVDEAMISAHSARTGTLCAADFLRVLVALAR